MAWAETRLTRALGLKLPLISGPMAGHTTVALASQVSNAGGLGSLGAAFLPADALRETIRDIKAQTSRPFAVNLFCRMQAAPTQAELQATYPSDEKLAAIRGKLGIAAPQQVTLRSPPLEDQVQVVLDEGVPVVSYTFGYLPQEMARALKAKGVYLMGTATTVAEALVLAGASPDDRKVDCVIAQGWEAGGHRGSFLPTTTPPTDDQDKLEHSQQPTLKLARAVRAALRDRDDIAIVAAGGISNAEDAAAFLAPGANDGSSAPVDGLVLGTLFMVSSTSGTPPLHREALMRDTQPTKVSRGMTGRFARGIPNELMRTFDDAPDLPSYDIHSSKTKDIIAHANQNSISDYMLLLSGDKHLDAAKYTENSTLSAEQVMNKLSNDLHTLLDKAK
ncbi:2-nitropropane dioxygenase [Gongronella butleri]|nr:2-nitropropane dioxygenase [Gongronella butleri]